MVIVKILILNKSIRLKAKLLKFTHGLFVLGNGSELMVNEPSPYIAHQLR